MLSDRLLAALVTSVTILVWFGLGMIVGGVVFSTHDERECDDFALAYKNQLSVDVGIPERQENARAELVRLTLTRPECFEFRDEVPSEITPR